MRFFRIILTLIIIPEFLGPGIQCLYCQSACSHPENSQKYVDYTPDTKSFLPFKNLDKNNYYHYDKTALERIHQLEEQKDLEALTEALKNYITQFGIKNFKKDDDLLWKLGQLYERDGQKRKAAYIYRVLLRHNKENESFVKQYYNDMNKEGNEYFVPVQYYYRMIKERKSIDTLRPPPGVSLNMGNNINSAAHDYGPSLNIKDDILLFTSQRKKINNGKGSRVNEDLFWSQRKNKKSWTKARALTGLNSQHNEGSPCLNNQGNMLYFSRCNTEAGYGDCDLYVSELKKDGSWGNPRNLGKNVNTSFWESQPSLSHTGDTLYFASDRLSGFGGADIYFTWKNKRGKWQPAKNTGPLINTKKNDLSPFYHSHYNVLYFSSDGQVVNFGEYDIYKAYKTGSGWSEPINIGPLVNGNSDEYYFTVDADTEYLFYAKSRNKNGKNLDLYSFPLPMRARPQATTTVKGTLKNARTGEPFKGIVTVIDLEKGVEVAPKFLRPNGEFRFDLINKNKYLLIIKGKDFFRVEKKLPLKKDTSLDIKTHSIDFIRLQFENIEFEENSAEILPKMKEDLDKLLNYILDNPGLMLKISGHTDSQGDPEYNRKLSVRRAKAIKNYMVEKAEIAPSRIIAKGYGSSKPIIKNEKTEKDRRTNRRVEFEIIRSEKMVDYTRW